MLYEYKYLYIRVRVRICIRKMDLWRRRVYSQSNRQRAINKIVTNVTKWWKICATWPLFVQRAHRQNQPAFSARSTDSDVNIEQAKQNKESTNKGTICLLCSIMPGACHRPAHDSSSSLPVIATPSILFCINPVMVNSQGTQSNCNTPIRGIFIYS